MNGTCNNIREYRCIDLRSDTLTKPTLAMREAMANAEVGDDVFGEDPTINKLESKCAKIFDKEAAIFLPSGSMGNLIAVMVHCSGRGLEAIVGDKTHIYLLEQGSAASLGGVHITPIENKPNGSFCLVELKRKIRGNDCHEAKTKLAAVENTHNLCGGTVLSLDFLDEFTRICKEFDLRTHMDGARIFNASEYLGVSVARITKDFDSVCFCLSKGLSAPVGSILIGSKKFIAEARRLRKALGGGMRQVGVLAAAGLVAIEAIVPILKYDHQRARKIAEAIFSFNSRHVSINLKNVQTNIILLKMLNGSQCLATDLLIKFKTVSERELADGICDENGVGIIIKASTCQRDSIRLVLYHEINDHDTDLIIKKIQYCLKELDREVA